MCALGRDRRVQFSLHRLQTESVFEIRKLPASQPALAWNWLTRAASGWAHGHLGCTVFYCRISSRNFLQCTLPLNAPQDPRRRRYQLETLEEWGRTWSHRWLLHQCQGNEATRSVATSAVTILTINILWWLHLGEILLPLHSPGNQLKFFRPEMITKPIFGLRTERVSVLALQHRLRHFVSLWMKFSEWESQGETHKVKLRVKRFVVNYWLPFFIY